MKMRILTILFLFFFAHIHGETEQIDKKIAILGTGLPGVGKSYTFHKLHQYVSNATYIDKDVINQVLLGDEEYFSDYYNRYVKQQSYDIMFALAKDNLRHAPKVIILDGFFGNKLSDSTIAAFINSPEFEVKIIHFYCSEEVNKQRLITRGDSRDREKLEDFSTYYKNTNEVIQKELSTVNRYLSINTENDCEENLRLIIDYLKN